MTTRRGVLGMMGIAALTGLSGACSPRTPEKENASDLLLITHSEGLGVFDTGKRDWAIPPLPAALSDRELATLDGQQLVLRHRKGLEIRSQAQLKGDWTLSAVGGDQIALIEGRNLAKSRESTTISIMRGGTERYRHKLPGSLEPEAFSTDGTRLFVLDHRGDTYRVRSVDLDAGRLEALFTREKQATPEFAEEVMRGQGHHSVYDSARGMLFTLFTHGGEHQHTGQLLGVRPDAPDIHAFIHALSLREGWAVCIDLPAPFGLAPAASHTITGSSTQLFVVAGEAGVVAEIDPVGLGLGNTSKIPPTPRRGVRDLHRSPDSGHRQPRGRGRCGLPGARHRLRQPVVGGQAGRHRLDRGGEGSRRDQGTWPHPPAITASHAVLLDPFCVRVWTRS